MILPNKHLTSEDALLGVGATILRYLNEEKTVSTLWYDLENQSNIGTFQNYILGLCFLQIINAIEFENNFIRKTLNVT